MTVLHAKIASAAVLMNDHFLNVKNKHSLLTAKVRQELHSNRHRQSAFKKSAQKKS